MFRTVGKRRRGAGGLGLPVVCVFLSRGGRERAETLRKKEQRRVRRGFSGGEFGREGGTDVKVRLLYGFRGRMNVPPFRLSLSNR